jgi:hypothetical protein
LPRKRWLKMCPTCGAMLEALAVECNCGMRFCSELCMNSHKLVIHKKIAGLV